jgi:ribosomal protein S18 acetylase RimI-like enzyme
VNSGEIEVRSYRDSDESGVVALWTVVFPDDPPWNEPRLVIRRKRAVQSDLFLVATRDSEILGTVLAGFDGCRGWVHHLAVAPRVRRTRIGSALMREAAAHLRALGAPKVNLQVRASNEDAVRFYESLGFEVEDRVSMAQLLQLDEAWLPPR